MKLTLDTKKIGKWLKGGGLLPIGIGAAVVLIISTGIYYYKYIKPRKQASEFIQTTLEDLSYIRSVLIEGRIKYVELTSLDVYDPNFVTAKESLYSDLESLYASEKFDEITCRFTPDEVNALTEEEYGIVGDLYSRAVASRNTQKDHVERSKEVGAAASNIYSYNPAEDIRSVLYQEDEDEVMERLNRALEGVLSYENKFDEFNNRGYLENNTDLYGNTLYFISLAEVAPKKLIACLQFEPVCDDEYTEYENSFAELKEAAWTLEKSFLVSEKSLQDLTNYTNLVIEYSSVVSKLIDYTKGQFALPEEGSRPL